MFYAAFSFIKNLAYFLLNILDLKFDFPLPPKNFGRLFSINFWDSMLQIYGKRKRHQKRNSTVTKNIHRTDIKSFWKEATFTPPSYSEWLRTSQIKTYGVVVWPEIFKLLASECESFFEAGCGSGLSSQCLLSFILEKQLEQKTNKKVIYDGIDLSDARVVLAQQYIEKFFNNSSNLNIECSFKQGDLETLNIEDKKYDISFVPSVLERVSDISIERVVEQVCRITKKYIYISDFFDHYPDGWPRDHKKQSDIFLKYGFELREFRYHMTDTARNQCELQLLFQRSILN